MATRSHLLVTLCASSASVLSGVLGLGRATADVINLQDIASPLIEPFEGILGVTVRPDLSNGFCGAPRSGLVLPSGLTFVSPDPNPSQNELFIICDYLLGNGTYDLCDNGVIVGPADLHSGTAYAGAAGIVGESHAYGFEFPIPAADFGVFVSACTFFSGAEVTLTTFDPGGQFIEAVTFVTEPVPLTDDNFIGLGGGDPIGSFEISSNDTFAFDDVIWEAAFLDGDNDGIPDQEDLCPDSDLAPTVIIDGCGSGVGNVLFDDGCTMADLIAECAEGASNHGDFVSCVAHLTNEWKQAGLITGQEKGAIQSCAAQSTIPGSALAETMVSSEFRRAMATGEAGGDRGLPRRQGPLDHAAWKRGARHARIHSGSHPVVDSHW